MFVFFKQKPAYEMRIRDWSSDVCSSDLVAIASTSAQKTCKQSVTRVIQRRSNRSATQPVIGVVTNNGRNWSSPISPRDRKSVVKGKGGDVRVDLGGRRIIKIKTYNQIILLRRTR